MVEDGQNPSKGARASIGKALKRTITREDELDAVVDKRLASSSVLMNVTRQKIFEELFLCPCIYLAALCADLSLKQPSAVWHLNKLASRGFIEESVQGDRHVFYPVGMVEKDDIAVLAILNVADARALYRAVAESPGMSRKELASSLGMGYNTATLYLAKLADLGMIDIVRDGKHARYFPTVLVSTREGALRNRMKGCRERIMKLLTSDGVQPRIVRRTEGELVLRIVSGSEEGFLHLHTKPFATLIAKK